MWNWQLRKAATSSQTHVSHAHPCVAKAGVRLEFSQPERIQRHLLPEMGAHQSIASPSHFKMTPAPKMATTAQAWAGGSAVSPVLMTQLLASGRHGNCNTGPCTWGSTGFCSFMAGRTTDGQGWMEPIVPLVHPSYRQGK